MLFLDSNVFLYALGRDHPLREPCRGVLERVRVGTLEANTSAEVLQEVLYVLARRGDAGVAARVVRDLAEAFPDAIAVTRTEVVEACAVLDEHPRLASRDAVHVATLRLHGLSEIVSADRHFDTVEGLRRVAPEELV